MLLLFLALGCLAEAQQAPPPPPPGQAITTAWPLQLNGPDGLISIYQPQPEKFEGDQLTARAAVSLTATGTTEPLFGAMWMQARVATDRDAGTVTILDAQVRSVKFPDASDQLQQQFAQIIQTEIPKLNVTFPLDQLLASLDAAQQEKSTAAQLQTAPPKIIFTTVPATLILIDGQPQLQAADTPGVMRVVNTPFIILLDDASKHYFVKAGDAWFTAGDVAGPWAPAAGVPPQINAAAAKLIAPPTPNAPPPAPPGPPPQQVLVATEPTELISSDGAPTYTPLPGNDLLYMSNTQSDVFMEVVTQQYYVLLAGRWFRAGSLQGPWTYVASDQLPASFANIPPDSPKANVLVSVGGTIEAQEARQDAHIPQTATIARDSGNTLSVAYDGAPEFESIQQTPVSYATNCSDPVFLVNNRYYCCNQAVWYDAAAAVGPWTVSILVPQPIYAIPPSCPYYYVRYCHIYDYTPSVVYCGYLPGYTGCYVYGSTVVYGTGYHYPGWYRHEYFPRPHTWGVGARYDVHYGTWADGAPYHWDRQWFSRGSERRDWWGPRGYLSYHRLAEGRARPVNVVNQTNVRNVTNVRNINIYNRPTNVRRNAAVSRNVQAGNQRQRGGTSNSRAGGRNAPAEARHAQAGPRHRPAGAGNAPAVARKAPARGGYSPVARNRATAENNVYAGHNGQIYRRTATGWEQRNGKSWQKLSSVPEAPPRQPAGRTPAHAGRGAQPARNAGQPGRPKAASPRQPGQAQPGRTERPRPEPTRAQTPERGQQAERAQQPARTPQRPAPRVQREARPQRAAPRHYSPPPGLEGDYAARQRGIQRSRAESPARARGAAPAARPTERGGGRSGGAAPARNAPAERGNSGGQQQQNRR